MLFEFGADDQGAPVEVDDRDGRPVVRLRRDAAVTPALINELNELLGGQMPAAVVARPPVVVVVVR